jgi:hypothetical protein
MRVAAVLVAAAPVSMVLAGCGGDDDPPLRLDRIDEAIAAVENERGGRQQYFEINATALLVNVFVASEDGVVPYTYVDDALASQAARPAEGATFSADAVTFDADTMLDAVTDELPDATLEVFSIVARDDGQVQYGVIASSSAGGTLDITLTPDGDVVAVDPG